MRNTGRHTSWFVQLSLAISAIAVQPSYAPPPATSQPVSPSAALVAQARERLAAGDAAAALDLLGSALEQWPRDRDLWLALIDVDLQRGRLAGALQRCRRAARVLGDDPAVCFRAAQAHYRLGQNLGPLSQVHTRDGRVGQFRGAHLLIEPSKSPGVFLCCGPDSALFQVRKALDGGLDTPAVHLLHARIWLRAGHPAVAWTILRSHRDAIVRLDDDAALQTLAEAALAADALPEYLDAERRRASRHPDAANDLLRQAYVAVARRYAERGQAAMQIAFLRRAAALGQPAPDLMLELGDALYANGQRADAAPWYQRLLEAVPNHPRRAELLARLTP